MSVTVICPNLRCRSMLQVPESARGQKVRCGRCGKNFIVPAPAPKHKRAAPQKPEGATPGKA
jgi:hypothetical protein